MFDAIKGSFFALTLVATSPAALDRARVQEGRKSRRRPSSRLIPRGDVEKPPWAMLAQIADMLLVVPASMMRTSPLLSAIHP
jgi:hypothetical protein